MGIKIITMGINNSPWLWNGRKSAGNMTLRTSRGQRIFQGKRTKGQSNPSSQYLYSQRVAALVWPYFRAAIGFIRDNWQRKKTGQTEASQFYAYTYKNAVDGTDPMAPVIQPENLIFSTGVMTATDILTLVSDVSATTTTVTWDPTVLDGSQLDTDNAWLVLRNRTKAITYAFMVGVNRITGSSGPIPNELIDAELGDVIDAYLSFAGQLSTANEGIRSDSRYATTIVVA